MQGSMARDEWAGPHPPKGVQPTRPVAVTQGDAVVTLSRIDDELSGSNGRAQMAQAFLLK